MKNAKNSDKGDNPKTNLNSSIQKNKVKTNVNDSTLKIIAGITSCTPIKPKTPKPKKITPTKKNDEVLPSTSTIDETKKTSHENPPLPKDGLDNQNKEKDIFNYDDDDRGPFIVYVDLIDEANSDGSRKPLNQLKCASILNKFGCREIITVHKISFRRCKVTFANPKSANWLANNKNRLIDEHKLHPRILERFALNFGLVFGIPEEYSDDELMDMVCHNPMYPVKSIQRVLKKNYQTGESTKTTRIKVGFKSTVVPDELKLGYAVLNCKYFFPAIRQCYNCQLFGHLAIHCKRKTPVCTNCAGEHSKDVCDVSFKNCANCGNAHPATDKACPKREVYSRIQKIMILDNLNYREAVKKLSIPEYNYHPSEFPTLNQEQTRPTQQQLVNEASFIHGSFTQNAKHLNQHSAKKPKKKMFPPSSSVVIPDDIIFKEIPDNTGPVFNSPIYKQHITAERERILKKLSATVSTLIVNENVRDLSEVKELQNLVNSLSSTDDIEEILSVSATQEMDQQ